MKQWNKPETRVVERPLFVPPVVADAVKVPSWLRCIECTQTCDMLYEGTSYCQKCLKEKLRRGV